MQNLWEDTKRQINHCNSCIDSMEDTHASFDEDPSRDEENGSVESVSTNDDRKVPVDHSENRRQLKNTINKFYSSYNADGDENDFEDTQTTR